MLPRTLDSLLKQDMEDFELIISDDQSTDETEQVCREYEAKDRRIKYGRNERRLGMPGNMNRAIECSSGTLVANLHDGDIYRVDMLSKCSRALKAQSDAAFVFNEYESIGKEGELVRHAHRFPERFEINELTRLMLQDLTSPVWGTVVARRSCYAAAGLFNPRYSWYSDVEMWMRLNLSFPVAYVPEPLMFLTPHEIDRPYAVIDWSHEQILVAMHEEIIYRMCPSDPVGLATQLKCLRRMRDSRWVYQLCCLLKQGNKMRYFEGLKIFRQEDSLPLKIAATAGLVMSPILLINNALCSVK